MSGRREPFVEPMNVTLGEVLQLHYGSGVVKVCADDEMPTMVWLQVETKSGGEALIHLPGSLARNLASALAGCAQLAVANEAVMHIGHSKSAAGVSGAD
jgi:hypothetical protein